MTADGLAQIQTPTELAQHLTAVRQAAGLTIREVGRRTDIPSATLGGYFSGRHLPTVNQSQVLVDVLTAMGVDDPDEHHDWVEALKRVRRESTVRRHEDTGPYRGLESFTEADDDIYFGRDASLAEVLTTLDAAWADPASPALHVLLGASGSGKTSLLRAGLIPRLRRAEGVAVAVMVPGADPLTALDLALSELGQPSADAVERRLLVVDQFEEVFGADITADTRRSLFARLAEVSDAAHGHTQVLLAVRADFYAAVAAEPALLPALQTAQIVLGPMTTAEMRDAIVRPAESAGVSVEPALVDLLMQDLQPRGHHDVAHDPGALPLMSHALLAAWRHRRRGPLGVDDYLASGRLGGAIEQSAEECLASLGPAQRDTARWLFGQLVQVDDDGVATRRRRQLRDLGAVGASVDPGVHEVIEAFVAARLLTVTDSTVEISHEALLDAWPRLRDWVQHDVDALRLHQRVSDATAVWLEHDRDPSVLLRGSQLALVADAMSPGSAAALRLTRDEDDFVQQSVAAEGQALADEQRRTRRLRVLLAATAVLALIAVVAAGLALSARSDAQAQELIAQSERDAAQSRQMAIAADRLRESDPALASQLALAAYQTSPTVQARSSLLDSTATPSATRFVGPEGTMVAVANPAGDVIAIAGNDGVVRVWMRAAAGWSPVSEVTVDADGAPLYAAAWSPDGTQLATGGDGAVVTVIDLSDPAAPEVLTTLKQPGSTVQGLTYNHSGTELAAATSDPAVLRWSTDTDTPRFIGRVTASNGGGFEGTVQSVAYAPDDTLIATASWDGAVRLFDVTPGSARVGKPTTITIGAPTDFVYSVAFSPDGATLAAGSKDSKVRLFDVSNPSRPTSGRVLTGFESWVNSVTFSPSGDLVAGAGSDGTARLWNVDDGTAAATLPTPANVTSVQFVDGDDQLLTSEVDGVGRLWQVPGPVIAGMTDSIWTLAYSASGDVLNVAPGAGDGALHAFDVSNVQSPSAVGVPMASPEDNGVNDGAAAFAPDGSWAAAGTATGGVAVWDTTGARPKLVATEQASTALIEAAAASRDSHLLASVGDDNAAVVYTVEDGAVREASRLEVPALPLSVTFGPDSDLLAVGAADGAIYLWQLDADGKTTELEPLTGFDNYVYAVAFDPGSTLFAAGSTDKTVRFWDLADPASPEPVGDVLRGPSDTVYSLSWNPVGDSLAGASTDGTVWVWDMSDPEQPVAMATLNAADGDLFSVTFRPDGGGVAAGGTSQVVTMWSADEQAAIDAICSGAGSPISEDEWARLVPGQAYTPPCGEGG